MEQFCEFRYLISKERKNKKNYGLKAEVKDKTNFLKNYLTQKND